MSNFPGYPPQFCLGYSQQYSVMMSVSDAYSRKFCMDNNQFRHWLPVSMNTNGQINSSTQAFFHPNVNNNSMATFPNSFGKVYSNYGKLASGIDKLNQRKVERSSCVNRNQAVQFSPSNVYSQPNVSFLEKKNKQFLPRKQTQNQQRATFSGEINFF